MRNYRRGVSPQDDVAALALAVSLQLGLELAGTMEAAQGNAAGVVIAEGAQAPAGREVQQAAAAPPVSALENFRSIFNEPMSPDEIAAVLASTQSELLFLWDRSKMSAGVQASFSALGFGEMDVFAQTADTSAELRKLVAEDLGVRDDLGAKAIIARILTAWEAAQVRGQKRKAKEAEQRAHDAPRPLTQKQHNELLEAHEQVHGGISDVKTPAKFLVDATMAQLEDGQLVAPLLSEIVSKREALGRRPSSSTAVQVLPGNMGITVAADGALKATKNVVMDVPLPTNPEEYRHRFDLMSVLWELICLQFPQSGGRCGPFGQVVARSC